jgi:SAM-dependent methyltransferase
MCCHVRLPEVRRYRVTAAHDAAKASVRRQFGPAAGDYATSEVHASGESLAVLIDRVQPVSTWCALDVATGAGHTALAFAPLVGSVVAFDLTAQMLLQVDRLAAQRDVRNVQSMVGDAGALPFPDATFDLVTCRLAQHHFQHQTTAVVEYARVLQPGGRLGFTDNVTVAEPDAVRWYNTYEQLRDPSHQWVYPLADLRGVIAAAGLRIETSAVFTKEFEFHAWADRQRVSPGDKSRLLDMMRTIPPTLQPLFCPRWADGTLYFSLWEAVIVARKM